jgi:hypothetical protein
VALQQTLTVADGFVAGQREAANMFARLIREAGGHDKCHGSATDPDQGELQACDLHRFGVRGASAPISQWLLSGEFELPGELA